MTLDEWIVSDKTGNSSKTMWAAIKGVDIPRPARPYDAFDFDRCYGLIKQCNVSSEALNSISEKYPFWQPFIDNWAELAELHEENQIKELNSLISALGKKSDKFKR